MYVKIALRPSCTRLRRPEILKLSPRIVLLWIGTNNFQASQPVCAIEAGLRAVLEQIKIDWPEAKIITLPLLPQGAQFDFRPADLTELNGDMPYIVSGLGGVAKINNNALTCGDFRLPMRDFSLLRCAPDQWPQCVNYAADHIHVTSFGYRLILDGLVAEYKRLGLGRGGTADGEGDLPTSEPHRGP